jgi:hypothetical protein
LKFYFDGAFQKLIKTRQKAILVADRGGPWDCEKSRLPHFLDNRLTGGGEVEVVR